MADRKKIVYPYIPNSVPEVQEEMLASIGAKSIDEFYQCIPEPLRFRGKMDLPEPFLDEYSLKRHMEKMLKKNRGTHENLSFLGGGCWQHHVPAVCDEINHRSEFLTAYAGEPYEDHGRFQALFEYTSMMGELLEMDAVNVPTYDGSQAASTALRMACRITGRDTVLVAENIHPDRMLVIRNYCHPGVTLRTVPFCEKTGTLDLEALKKSLTPDVAGLYVENPNFLGALETEASKMAELLHSSGALFVVGVDPSSLGVLAPPVQYGADIVCGDIQPLGMHMYAGGARAGFIATRDEERFVQQFPSRLFGVAPTTHKEWGFGDVAWERTSFAKREEAVEFVGTASALWGITAGVYLALMGPQGMKDLGEGIFQRSAYLAAKVQELPGVKVLFEGTPFFKEFAVNFQGTGKSVQEINKALLERGVFGCLDLSRKFPSLGETGLFCVTEVHSQDDMDTLVRLLKEILG